MVGQNLHMSSNYTYDILLFFVRIPNILSLCKDNSKPRAHNILKNVMITKRKMFSCRELNKLEKSKEVKFKSKTNLQQ